MHSDIRKQIARAKLSEEAFGVIVGEIFLVSAGAGFLAGSWWVFGTALLALLIGFGFRRVAICLVVVFSLIWGVIGALLGLLADLTIASVLLAITGFVAGVGIHLRALEWVEDQIPSNGE